MSGPIGDLLNVPFPPEPFTLMTGFVEASQLDNEPIEFADGSLDTQSGQELYIVAASGTGSATATGIPNDDTVYTFNMRAGIGLPSETDYPVSLAASDIQTWGSLVFELETDFGMLGGGGAGGLNAKMNFGGSAAGFDRPLGIVFQTGNTGGGSGKLGFLASTTNVFQAASHLIGASVDIVADGAVHPQRVVASNGTVTLQVDASSAIVGLKFTPELELLHPEPFQGDSTRVQQFQPRYINFLVQDTIGTDIVFQTKDGNEKRTETIPARSFGDNLDEPIPPFTGTTRVSATGWESPFNLIIRQNIPMPITILSVIMEFAIDDN